MEHPLCDLVLLSWNHLEETQPCLESLFETTRVPCRLLIVDNGSEQDVRAFLGAVKPRGAIREVVVLQNERNEGFPKGMNRGIAASTAPFVCLLNNDLRFTTGWLKEMLRVAQANPTIGVLNPRSSTFGDRPAHGVSLQAFADGFRRFTGRYMERGMCIGFCLLIKREVLDLVGGFSEEVDRAFFEDEDFSMRVQRAGFYCVMAEAAYVYHAEHRSVRDMPEREALFVKNRRWCYERWGRWVRTAWIRCRAVRPGSNELRAWLEDLISWARRRGDLYVYVPMRGRPEQLFESVGLVPHSDIHLRRLPERLSRIAALGRILKRKKSKEKRYDMIIAPDERWARWARRLAWWHGASVVEEDNHEGLTRIWQEKSRSLS